MIALSATIAEFVHSPPVLPDSVCAAGRRSLLNMVGTAIGGSNEAAIRKLVAMLPAFSGPATASLIGRSERADMLWAAYINAASANIFDFDDTHVPTVIHPSAPVAPAVLALAETLAAEGKPVTGSELIEAFVLGAEVTCRLGNALHPVHYARGWHITSTCGAFGAALAAGRLLRLSPAQLVDALGHALAQGAGSVETLGTMSKSLSVGQAARAGLMSAFLAAKGYTGPAAPLEGPRGFLALHLDAPDFATLTDGLGSRWEILKNTFKPYPCGVVLNPVIEACLALHAQGDFSVDAIASIRLTGHPLLRQRTDRPNVTTGRLSQVSAQHAVAVSLLWGRADLEAFSDQAVQDPQLKDLASKLSFVDDLSFTFEAAEVCLSLNDGRKLVSRIDAAKGGLDHPMTDADLAVKFRAQIGWRGIDLDADELITSLEAIEDAADGAAFLAMTRDTTDMNGRAT
ncbi:MmgE/PrpD family protein [Ochrobactrum sp. MYb15]|uniref:MmgE/PrpD family protein n=1 Tax=Brucella TaxID=234 RepID=UPI0004664252|nr:MmgE/PrpD family protein [Brucella rhizosphaerae]PQZ50772.1 MmgE/PrpD family protein [Ochrobactrum sp. MYb19]PRA68812.1 MmgE/PrpD family protein [Ochrobactrum sp. MYb18]PRA73960.1 MmgE/PrpD family protein [Brucella thiophenivorans]PRA91064.1 MmgE/PrpD family protein [Ochrobactrum sp. MYb14]PRA96515.1 MmgE/PrpD family protein [Ochrobactrum sp. MYb15]